MMLNGYIAASEADISNPTYQKPCFFEWLLEPGTKISMANFLLHVDCIKVLHN